MLIASPYYLSIATTLRFVAVAGSSLTPFGRVWLKPLSQARVVREYFRAFGTTTLHLLAQLLTI